MTPLLVYPPSWGAEHALILQMTAYISNNTASRFPSNDSSLRHLRQVSEPLVRPKNPAPDSPLSPEITGRTACPPLSPRSHSTSPTSPPSSTTMRNRSQQ